MCFNRRQVIFEPLSVFFNKLSLSLPPKDLFRIRSWPVFTTRVVKFEFSTEFSLLLSTIGGCVVFTTLKFEFSTEFSILRIRILVYYYISVTSNA